MARRYLKVVGLLVVLLGVLAVTVVAAQAKAGRGLGMSVLKMVAGHEEEVRMSEAATSGMMFGKGRLMSRGEQDTDATCGAGEGEKMDCGAGEVADMTRDAGEVAEMDCGDMDCGDMDCGDMDCSASEASASSAAAQDVTSGTGDAAEMDCGTGDAAEMTSGAGRAAQKHCGPMDMGPDCGGELGCGVEAEADKS